MITVPKESSHDDLSRHHAEMQAALERMRESAEAKFSDK
jgi:hypothetical protein